MGNLTLHPNDEDGDDEDGDNDDTTAPPVNSSDKRHKRKWRAVPSTISSLNVPLNGSTYENSIRPPNASMSCGRVGMRYGAPIWDRLRNVLPSMDLGSNHSTTTTTTMMKTFLGEKMTKSQEGKDTKEHKPKQSYPKNS